MQRRNREVRGERRRQTPTESTSHDGRGKQRRRTAAPTTKDTSERRDAPWKSRKCTSLILSFFPLYSFIYIMILQSRQTEIYQTGICSAIRSVRNQKSWRHEITRWDLTCCNFINFKLRVCGLLNNDYLTWNVKLHNWIIQTQDLSWK